jgi:hypothetical protein
MKVTHSLAQLQKEHVVLELECIDRMYLNAYVPKLTSEGGIAAFCRGYLGHRFASTKQAVTMTKAFVKSIEGFIQSEGLELVRFKKGQRKDDVLQQKLRRFKMPEGLIFVGVAQEKVRVPRTTRKACPGGGTIPWIIYSTAMVNVYYFYCRDQDFGPFFLKFCSYFPYSANLCLNGHEYLKCQLAQRGIAFQALDNGLLACADLPAAQRLCDGLSDTKIDAFFRKWLARLSAFIGIRSAAAGVVWGHSRTNRRRSGRWPCDHAALPGRLGPGRWRERLDLGDLSRGQRPDCRRRVRRNRGSFPRDYKGVVSDAGDTLADFVFSVMQVDVVMTYVFAQNKLARQVNRNCGLKETGRVWRRRPDGSEVETIEMKATRAQWEESRRHRRERAQGAHLLPAR